MKKKIGFFVPMTLGLLTAFGPFITDFYLPAMPAMSESFRTSPSLVALSLTTGMAGWDLTKQDFIYLFTMLSKTINIKEDCAHFINQKNG